MPIVDIEGLGKIEFPDSMTQEQIDRAIKNEILPMVAQRVPSAIVAGIAPASAAGANPFSKGTAKADPNYKPGDRYRYRVIDLLTKVQTRESRGGMVKAVTDSEVIYGNGRVTDLLGNTLIDRRGRTYLGNQIFVAEYSIGRKWTTVYRGLRKDNVEDEWTLEFKVVARETITVPAGTFDAFKTEGSGFVRDSGTRVHITYWVAPDRVRPFIVYELTTRRQGGRFAVAERSELMEYRQRGSGRRAPGD
jgi:hypothetical protein